MFLIQLWNEKEEKMYPWSDSFRYRYEFKPMNYEKMFKGYKKVLGEFHEVCNFVF